MPPVHFSQPFHTARETKTSRKSSSSTESTAGTRSSELWAVWRQLSLTEGRELHLAALGSEWPLAVVTFSPGSPPPRALQDETRSSKLWGNPCSVSPGKKHPSCFLLAEQRLRLTLLVQMGGDQTCTPPGLGESCSPQRSRQCPLPTQAPRRRKEECLRGEHGCSFGVR